MEKYSRDVIVMGLDSQNELWVNAEWQDRPELGPWLTSDGRDVIDLVEEHQLDEIGFPIWFERSPYSRDRERPRADVLWAGGMAYKLVSETFAKALEELGVTGFSTYEVDFRDRKGSPIHGYVGLLEDLTGESELTTPHLQEQRRGFSLLTSQRVLDGLHAAGVTRFRYEAYHPEEFEPQS